MVINSSNITIIKGLSPLTLFIISIEYFVDLYLVKESEMITDYK